MTNPAPAKSFHYWQWRTILATMVGYSLFYFVRKNLSMAMPGMSEDLGVTKTSLGIFLTLHGLVYGVSKFLNGIVGDRVNSRAFMVAGLVLAAGCNILFGLSSSVIVLGLVWIANGWFQGMGFPPCSRLITHWVPPNELATKMSVWNASHSIGAGLVVVLCGYIASGVNWQWELGPWHGIFSLRVEEPSWRWCFFIPSGIAILGAIGLWFALRDTPSSVGHQELPAAGGKKAEPENSVEFKKFIREKVFRNPVVWTIGVANFFIYTMRYAILDWGPTFLKEWKHLPIEKSGWMVFAFELAGIVGMLIAGWATDRFFGGRGSRVCLICMALATLAVGLLWLLPASPLLMTGLLIGAGFFIYGPQALTGVIVANLVTRRASATAIGFTSLFSYASTLLSGTGLGWCAEKYGWPVALGVVAAAGVLGALVFAFVWKVKPNGYGDGAEGGSRDWGSPPFSRRQPGRARARATPAAPAISPGARRRRPRRASGGRIPRGFLSRRRCAGFARRPGRGGRRACARPRRR
jgi:OPA family glycerol-3-phosphate transporter-like MFS transporter/OPA family sugar phosphate sensor protein UhpC-like MFS transporter